MKGQNHFSSVERSVRPARANRAPLSVPTERAGQLCNLCNNLRRPRRPPSVGSSACSLLCVSNRRAAPPRRSLWALRRPPRSPRLPLRASVPACASSPARCQYSWSMARSCADTYIPEPPVCCAYRIHRAACLRGPHALYVRRRTRTSLGRAARTAYRGTAGAKLLVLTLTLGGTCYP